MLIAKIVEGLAVRSGFARAAVLGGVPAWLCFTVPALAQPQPQQGAADDPPAAPATATPATATPAATSGASGDVAPRLAEVLAQPGGLTAAEAARRAAETSVQGAIEREDVRTAANAKSRIIWGAAPRLTLTARTTRLSEVDALTFTDPVTGETASFAQPEVNHFLNAGLTIPLSDYVLRLVQALRGASTSRDAALLEERAARVTSGSNARISYYDWVRSRLETIVAEQALVTARAQLARMQALYSVGRAAQADLLQAQAFEADAQLTLSQSQTFSSIAEERLRVAIHTRPDEALTIGEDVLADFPAKEEPRSVDELYREALGARLEIKALERGHAALEDSRRVEASQAWPRLEAFGNVTHANPNQRIFPLEQDWNTTWDLGLQLVWSVNDVGLAVNQADTVAAQVTQLEQRRIGVEEAVRVEVVSAFGALNQARQNIATAEQGERAAAAAFAARERLQEQGMGTALELMQAETARIRARLNLISAHIALRVARTQLDHAVGRDVAGELGP